MSKSKEYVLKFKGFEGIKDPNSFISKELLKLSVVNVNPFQEELCEPDSYAIFNGYMVYRCDDTVYYFNEELRRYLPHVNQWIEMVEITTTKLTFSNLEKVNYKTLCDDWWSNKLDIFRYKLLNLI